MRMKTAETLAASAYGAAIGVAAGAAIGVYAAAVTAGLVPYSFMLPTILSYGVTASIAAGLAWRLLAPSNAPVGDFDALTIGVGAAAIWILAFGSPVFLFEIVNQDPGPVEQIAGWLTYDQQVLRMRLPSGGWVALLIGVAVSMLFARFFVPRIRGGTAQREWNA